MASKTKTIRFPNDFANRANTGTRNWAKYVLAKAPYTAHVTIQRGVGADVFVNAWVGVGDPMDSRGGVITMFFEAFEAVTREEDLLPALQRARECILDFLRRQVVTAKATLNAAKK